MLQAATSVPPYVCCEKNLTEERKRDFLNAALSINIFKG